MVDIQRRKKNHLLLYNSMIDIQSQKILFNFSISNIEFHKDQCKI